MELPPEFLAKTVLSNRMVLPTTGLSFEYEGEAIDGGDPLMFGGGWIAMPLFGGAIMIRWR